MKQTSNAYSDSSTPGALSRGLWDMMRQREMAWEL